MKTSDFKHPLSCGEYHTEALSTTLHLEWRHVMFPSMSVLPCVSFYIANFIKIFRLNPGGTVAVALLPGQSAISLWEISLAMPWHIQSDLWIFDISKSSGVTKLKNRFYYLILLTDLLSFLSQKKQIQQIQLFHAHCLEIKVKLMETPTLYWRSGHWTSPLHWTILEARHRKVTECVTSHKVSILRYLEHLRNTIWANNKKTYRYPQVIAMGQHDHGSQLWGGSYDCTMTDVGDSRNYVVSKSEIVHFSKASSEDLKRTRLISVCFENCHLWDKLAEFL